MSINSALLAGVSGLVSNASALASISDNISNVNTTGYKRNQVDFSTMVTSQAVKGEYSAGGVQGVTHTYVSQQGLIQSAASSTDLAISGDGFFVVTTKGAGLTAADPRSFTRAGSFQPDASGFLVNNAGLYLQGWPVQANGTFNINPSDVNSLSSINVKNLGAAVQQTGNVSLSANLNQTAAVSAAEATYNGTTVASMADYASNPATGTKPAPGLRSISRMAAAPASRLPITATRRPRRFDPRCQAKSLEWKRITPIPDAANMQPTTTTNGGTSSMWMALPTGQKAMSTHSVVATDKRS